MPPFDILISTTPMSQSYRLSKTILQKTAMEDKKTAIDNKKIAFRKLSFQKQHPKTNKQTVRNIP